MLFKVSTVHSKQSQLTFFRLDGWNRLDMMQRCCGCVVRIVESRGTAWWRVKVDILFWKRTNGMALSLFGDKETLFCSFIGGRETLSS